MKPITELRTFLSRLLPDLRRRRQFGDVLNVEVAQEIASDVAAQHQQLHGLAYSAEQCGLSAKADLTGVFADGKITPDEQPIVDRAMRHLDRNIGHCHLIGQGLSA